jgi:O-antigen/teichoic acid export membrane protein
VLIQPAGSVYTALGKTKAMFQVSAVLLVVFVLLMIPAVRFGLLGVTWAYTAWTLVAGLLNLWVVGRYMDSSARAILASVAPTAIIAMLMGALVYAVDVGPVHTWPLAIRLLIGLVAGMSSYLVMCVLTKNEAFADFVRLISERLGLDMSPYWVRWRGLMNK